jgi:hypothetical protein
MNMNLIDEYLASTIINKRQHQAAKKMLNAADKSALKSVRKRCGTFPAYVVDEVVFYEWDCSAEEYCVKCLREGLDHIAEVQAKKKGTPLHAVLTAQRGVSH